MTNSSFAYIRRFAGLTGFTLLTSVLILGPAVAQEERQSLQGRSLEQRADEPGRASAEAEQQIAGALAEALENSDYARKRQALGLQDVGDAAFVGFKMKRSAEEWRRLLTPAQFSVVQGKAAEPSNETFEVTESGVYACTCDQPLFHTDAAAETHSQLAHFHRPVDPAAVVTDVTSAWSLEAEKVELRCSMCGAHLGYVDPGQDAEDPLVFKLKPTALVFAAGSPE